MATVSPAKIQERSTRQAPPSARRSWWQGAAETLALAALTIAFLETFLGMVGVGMEEILQPDPQLGTRHIPNKKVVWRMEGYSSDTFSSAGLRDVEHTIAKPAGTFRVALLGDSATEGLQVSLKNTYGVDLQQMIKKPGLTTEVMNFGCSGYGTGQEVLQFEQQVLQYKPDLTILLYNRGDTIENVRKPTDFSCEPRPYFYLDEQGALQQDNALLHMYAKALQANPVMDFLREKSRIYGVLTQANLNLSLHEPLYRKIRGWLLSPWTPRMAKSKHAAAYAPQNAWAVTDALMKRLNRDCIDNGGKLVVIDFPNTVQDPEYGGQIENLKKAADTDQFGILDLTPSFRWNPDPMSLFVQYHFSAKGHRFVAKQIAEYLQHKGY